MGEPEPLRDIPLHITIDGVTVTGFIDYWFINDVTVEITSHGAGRRNGTHVSALAMGPVNRLALFEGRQTTAITPRAQQRAESLLREALREPEADPGSRHEDGG